MGQLGVFATQTLGRVVGGAIGGPVGGAIGGALGGVLGNALFGGDQPNQTVFGPRLQDLGVSSSTYGSAIPQCYGTLRLGGNMIWSQGLEEVETRSKQQAGGKGGGGGGSTTTVTYEYFHSFALAYAGTEADGLLRLWADGTLIYDVTGSNADLRNDISFRFYRGSETQDPDSLIEADKGEGMVPAYRGLCYIVFDRLPLANFGNRTPNIEAEIAFRSTTGEEYAASTDGTQPSGTRQTEYLDYDPIRKRYYVTYAISGSHNMVQYQADTLAQQSTQTITAATGKIVGRYTGNIYATENTSNQARIFKYSPDSFSAIASFGTDETFGDNDATGFENVSCMAEGAVNLATGGTRRYLACITAFDENIGVIDADSMSFVFATNNTPASFDNHAGNIGVAWATGSVLDFWFTISGDTQGDITLRRVRLTPFGFDSFTTSTIPSTIWDGLDGWGGGSASDNPVGPIIDPNDNGLIFIVADAGGFDQCAVFKLNPDDLSAEWVVKLTENQGPFNSGSGGRPGQNYTYYSRIVGGRLGIMDGTGSFHLIDTNDGSTIVSGDAAASTERVSPDNSAIWDGLTNSFVMINGIEGQGTLTSQMARVYPFRVTGDTVTLSSVVQDICERAGLVAASDLTTTDLTSDVVKGYVIPKQMTHRQALEPLALAFNFDGVESEGRVKFVKRDGAVDKAVTEAQLQELNGNGEVIGETRVEETELPERMNINYLNQNADYQQGSASTKRMRSPSPTMRSRLEESIEFPIVLTEDDAVTLTERLLYQRWNGRISYRLRGGPELLELDPMDVITVTLDSGTVFNLEVEQVDLGADRVVEVQGTRNAAAVFTSSGITSDGAEGFTVQDAADPVETKTIIPNIPLLRDVDDTGSNISRVYFVMNGFEEGWRRGVLYRSPAGEQDFASVSNATAGADWGLCSEALPDTETPFQYDETTTLTIRMVVGTLSSVTEAQWLADSNTAIIGSHESDWEVIGYRDVTDNGDGSYTISGLLRGKRGTEFAVDGHTTNEFFIPVDATTLSSFLMGSALRNQAQDYKGVGAAQIPEDIQAESITLEGRDLKSWAPANLEGVLGGGDIVMTWNRRSRLGGELQDDTGDIPLPESAEQYLVRIYDATDLTTPLRTVGLTGGGGNGTEVTSETYTYTAAQISTDGSVADIRFTVSQYNPSFALEGFVSDFSDSISTT